MRLNRRRVGRRSRIFRASPSGSALLGPYRHSPTAHILAPSREHLVKTRRRCVILTCMKPCGTLSAYARHIRKRETPCQPCKDANALRRKEYYAANASKIYEINRRWASKNPEKVKEYSRRMASKRKALKKNNGHIPYTDQQVFDTYGTDCHICKMPIDFSAPRQAYIASGWELGLQLDHLVPLSKGGSDTLENIRPSHALCNMKKRNL